MTDETSAPAPDGQVARPADTIPVEATPTPATIETAATINAAQEAKAAPAAETPEPQAEPEPERKVKKLDEWAEKRIADEAFKAREEARQRRAAEAEAEALRRQLEALQAPQGQQTPVAPPQAAPAPLAVNPQDFDRAVAVEAERRAAVAKFNEDCNKVHSEGAKQFPDFEDALKNLGALGALNEQTLQTIIATGEGPRLLYELGSDPEKAAEVFKLPPALQAIELGKRAAVRPAGKAPAPVSNAPAPIRPLEGSARVSNEPRDDDDDQTYFAKRLEQRRAARR